MDLAFTPVRCASYSPQGQTITSRATPTRNLLHNTKPTKIRITSSHFHKHHQLPELQYNVAKDKVVLSRRDALGLGLCTSVFFHQVVEPAAVSAEEASSTNSKCQFKVAPSGIQFCDEVVGYGPEATKGELIKAHYVGKLENGKVFDSSYNRGKPLTFRIGVGEVIKGWDQGILGADGIPPMLTGGKRSLRLPPELAYGMRGAGCKGGSCIIPPDSVLLFDVEFIGKA